MNNKWLKIIIIKNNQYKDTYYSAKHTLLTKSQLDWPTSNKADIIINTFKNAITKLI